MNKKAKIVLIIVIVLIIAGMAFYPNIKNMLPIKDGKLEIPIGTGNREQRSLNVNAQVLKYENLDDIFRTKGILMPDEEVDLSFETSGKITNIYFKEGTVVNKGDL